MFYLLLTAFSIVFDIELVTSQVARNEVFTVNVTNFF